MLKIIQLWFLYRTLPYFPTFHKEIQSLTWHRKLASWWFRPISKISIKSDDFAQYGWTVKSKKKLKPPPNHNYGLQQVLECGKCWVSMNLNPAIPAFPSIAKTHCWKDWKAQQGENSGASFKRTGRITHHAMENAIDKQIVLTFESSTEIGQPS